MTQLKLNEHAVLSQLQSEKCADVVDESGKLLGRVVFQKMTYPELGLTDEELRSRERDPNAVWLSANQVSEHFRNRTRTGS